MTVFKDKKIMISKDIVNKDIKRYFIILSSIFIVSFIIGYLLPINGKQKFLMAYQSSIIPLTPLFGFKRFIYILYRNTLSSFIIIIIGIFYGIAPVISIVLDGYLSGCLYSLASLHYGYFMGALKIFPHDIVETPAVIIASAYSLWLGISFANRKKQSNKISIINNLLYALKMNLKIVFPLLIIASLIETYLTPFIFNQFK